MTLAELQLAKLGFDPNSGVEKQITAHAMSDKQEITGFETLNEQLGLLANLSASDQIKFLDLTLEEMDEMKGETDALVAAWRTGNAAKLAGILSEEYGVAPGLYATLVSDRNRRWVPQIEKLLKSDKNYMVVVRHAAHRGQERPARPAEIRRLYFPPDAVAAALWRITSR